MTRHTLALLILPLAIACRHPTSAPPAPHLMGATIAAGPVNPVVVVSSQDGGGQILGGAENPMYTSSAASSGGGGGSAPVLASTGSTPAAGLVAKASAGDIQGLYVFNNTASNAWVVIANQTAAVSAFTGVGAPVVVPSLQGIFLGTDYFGNAGWIMSTGISVGMSTTRTGAYSSAGANFDIEVHGS